MKVEQLISQFLFLHKSITLQGIGSFHVIADLPPIAESDKSISLPADAISYAFNLKAEHDANFISYVMQQTGKIKPLATSDLESFLILGKQFLNIGKPFVIHNLGAIVKTQSGTYEFIQTNHVAPDSSEQYSHPQEKEKNDTLINFASPRKNKSANFRYLPLILALSSTALILIIIITVITKNNSSPQKKIDVRDTGVVKSIENKPAKSDTLVNISNVKPIVDTSSADYKIVVRKYNKQVSADDAFTKLSGYEIGKNLIKYRKDSTTFYLAIPMHGKLSDTLKIRDSIKVLFGKNAFVDFN